MFTCLGVAVGCGVGIILGSLLLPISCGCLLGLSADIYFKKKSAINNSIGKSGD